MKYNSLLDRLHATSLRMTLTRIEVMQALESVGDVAIDAKQVLRLLMERGMRSNIGTIYRTLHECELAGLVVRGHDERGRGLYRIKPDGYDSVALRVQCRVCGGGAVIHDIALHEHVMRASQRAGVGASGQAVTIAVTCSACATACRLQ